MVMGNFYITINLHNRLDSFKQHLSIDAVNSKLGIKYSSLVSIPFDLGTKGVIDFVANMILSMQDALVYIDKFDKLSIDEITEVVTVKLKEAHCVI